MHYFSPTAPNKDISLSSPALSLLFEVGRVVISVFTDLCDSSQIDMLFRALKSSFGEVTGVDSSLVQLIEFLVRYTL